MRRLLGRRFLILAVSVLSVLALALTLFASDVLLGRTTPSNPSSLILSHPTITLEVKHDVSPVLRTLPGASAQQAGEDPDKDFRRHLPPLRQGAPNNLRAPVQPRVISPRIPAASNNFDGVGNGFTGPGGTFFVNAAPPDTNGSV